MSDPRYLTLSQSNARLKRADLIPLLIHANGSKRRAAKLADLDRRELNRALRFACLDARDYRADGGGR